VADRVVWSGPPGDTHTNDTAFVQYQLHCNLERTCGECLQYHEAIQRGPWPIPLHVNCNCRQTPIPPGKEAAEPFTDFRKILDDMPPGEQQAAIGTSNYKLLKEGVVEWKDIVTPSRVRPLREVVALKRLTVEEMERAGVDKKIAEAAHASVHTAEHELIHQQRMGLIHQLQDAGLHQNQLVEQLSRGLAAKVGLAEGPASYAEAGYPPAWPAARVAPFRYGTREHTAELLRLLRGPEPPPPPAAPAPPQPPVPAGPAPAGAVFSKHEFGEPDQIKFRGYSDDMKAQVAEIFGRPVTEGELSALAGAPSGSRVEIEAKGQHKFEIYVEHPALREMTRIVEKEADGKLVVTNEIFRIREEHQGGKMGLNAFAREVEQAQKLGVDRIETGATRHRHDLDPATGKEKYAGYYVWPRFGYDGALADATLQELAAGPDSLRGATRVSELMATPEGRSWWKENGRTIDITFDVKKGSHSLAVLDNYLNEVLPK
jgi:hypothetical protein